MFNKKIPIFVETMAKYKLIKINVDGNEFPVKFYEENRKNTRMSFAKDCIMFRIPLFRLPGDRAKAFEWLEDCVRKSVKKHPEIVERYKIKQFEDGSIIQVGERNYTLKIEYTDKKTHTGRLRNGIIHLKLVKDASDMNMEKSTRHLLSRLVAKDFKPHIERRVLELNQLYFKESIKSVNLKYNQSNWGSCSTKGNINLSTRLLFAPDEVIDYVIIHELAHLKEMNHSPKFWKWVADAMPDYKQKEKWLKVNRSKCDF